ncbi:MAG: sugar transferase [Kiritimatiellae bacterium]|nr:sugar transferase [Kiritimatiellia bacterium]
MKRLLDFIFSLVLLFLLFPLYLVLAVVIKLTSPGPVLHVSKRIGKNNVIFDMLKFRTMRVDTPQMATHLMKEPEKFVTPIGKFLRKTSLDEVPQLINVLKGDMSFVGPRPALFNQDDLVQLRTEKGVHVLIPGITGWAQVNGRDDIPIPVKVELDAYYLAHRSAWLDLKIFWMTVVNVIKGKNVSH